MSTFPSSTSRAAVAVAFTVLAILAGCGKKSDAPPAGDNGNRRGAAKPAEEVSVATATALRTAIPRKIEFVGSLAGVEQVTLSSEVDGTVETVRNDLGDPVRKGQVLASLVQDEFLQRKEQARSELDQIAARLGIPPGTETADIEQTSLVRKALAEYDNARKDLERRKDLAGKNLIAKKDVDDADARFLVAEANVRAAREESNNLLASLRGKKATLAIAEKKLRDTGVKSPIDGSIESRMVSAGEYVKVGTPLFRIVDDRTIRLLGEVPEFYAASLKTGLPVELAVDGRPGKTYRGTLKRISPASNAANRAILVEGNFPNANRELKSGFFGKAAILLRVDPDGVSVPKQAVVTFAGVEKVFVIDNNAARERRVKLGQDLGDRIEIVEGIAAGDQVAVSRTGKLVDGSRVRIEQGDSK
ncbi:MAG TPA: efflux RND transporter periplasmic adaptor subunit [Candidatus Methylomirabilis sp.]|nr:efflux RND transporter periplasmic adaptor subunit [Candidatus Methylomirabilis sp.]